MDDTRGMETEIMQRMSAAWRNWKRRSGVRQEDASETEGKGIQNNRKTSCVVIVWGRYLSNNEGGRKHD